MILVIDNYDSFTYNLVHYPDELGADTLVYRNDAITAEEGLGLRPDAVVLSPGPCTPNEAGICLRPGSPPRAADLAILGVCSRPSGDRPGIRRRGRAGKTLMHGKTSAIHHNGTGLFAGAGRRLSSLPGITVCRWPERACRRVWRLRPGPTTARSWGSRTGRGRFTGCSSIRRSIETTGGHHLLGNFLAVAGVKTMVPA